MFIGSGHLYLAMLFAAAFVGEFVAAYSTGFDRLPGSATFTVAREFADNAMNMSVWPRHSRWPRVRLRFALAWFRGGLCLLVCATALTLLHAGHYIDCLVLMFLIRVLLPGLHILIENFDVWAKVGDSDSETNGDACFSDLFEYIASNE